MKKLLTIYILSSIILTTAFSCETKSDLLEDDEHIIYTHLQEKTMQFTQPDGNTVDVLLTGDSYFMNAKSPDGYTLVYDTDTNWICYGQMSDYGEEIISSGIHYSNNPSRSTMEEISDRGITQELKYTEEQIQEIRNNKMNQLGSAEEINSYLQSESFTQSEQRPIMTGNFTQVVILVDFPDRPANISKSNIEVSYNNMNGDSIKSWVWEMSNNNVKIHTYVVGYYRARYKTSHYLAPNYSTARELINEALVWADNKFDFSKLSKASDGKVKNFIVMYTGKIIHQGWATSLWPHAGGNSYVTKDGVTTGRYYFLNMGEKYPRPLGTDKHELGHSFFYWPDTYDYDGDSKGAGGFATETTLPCAPFRAKHGWIKVININNANKIYNLPEDADTVLKYTNPKKPQEYFMIEYMKKTSYRQKAPDEGILIWHVDTKDGKNSYNQMTNARHFAYSVEQADGLFELEKNKKGGSDGDLFHANFKDKFNNQTGPNARWWDGTLSGLKVSQIGDKGGTTMRLAIGNAPQDTQAPSAPSGLSSYNVTSKSLSLKWNASNDNVGVTEYRIFKNGNLINTITGTSVNITGLNASTNYSFYVKAKDAAGNISSASNKVSVKTLPLPDTQAPSAPSGLSSYDITSKSISLKWNASSDNVGVTGYEIYRNEILINTITGISVNITGLQESTNYSFYVKAKDAAGNVSNASNTVSVKTSANNNDDGLLSLLGCNNSNSKKSSNASLSFILLMLVVILDKKIIRRR